jgi:phage-related tail protein
MSEAVEKLSGKLGVDTTDFKTAIGAANRELRVLESSFKAGAAALGDWTKDATGLESRMKTLTNQIDIQKLKVAALQEEHKRLAEENGANSRAAQDAEIKLNKETETLNKMERELGTTSEALNEMQSGTDETGDSVEDLGNETEETGGKLKGFETVLSGVGATIKTTIGIAFALIAAVIAIGSSLTGMMLDVAGTSAELVDLSAKTGISVEQLQEMAYIGDQVGTSLDTITGAQSRLVRAMAEGRDGTGAQAEAFKTLGVGVEDAAGNLRDTQDVFADVIDRLGEIENPAERDALAMALFGKSAQELNPLIAAGSDELARLADEAHNVGAVMSEEDVAAFEAFDDTLASLQAGLKGTVGTLLTAFLPGFQSVFDQVGEYLGMFKEIVDGSDGDFGKLAEGLTGLVTKIATDVAQQAPQMLAAGLAVVQSILNAITAALPSMLTAAISILTALLNFIVENLPSLIGAGVDILLVLIDAIVANLPMLIEAALAAIIALAEGLTEAAPELIPAIYEAIVLIVQTLLENLPLLVDVAGQLLLAIATGIINGLPYLSGYVIEGKFFPTLINALKRIIPSLLTTGKELLFALAEGLVDAIPDQTLAAGSAFLENIIYALASNAIQFTQAGASIIQWMVDGLVGGAGALYDAVVSIVEAMIAAMLGALVPPTNGGASSLSGMGRLFAAAGGGLGLAAAGASSSSGMVQSSTTDNFQFFAPVILQGSTPPGSLGSVLKGKRA